MRKRHRRMIRRRPREEDLPPSTLETGTSHGADPLPGELPHAPYDMIVRPKD